MAACPLRLPSSTQKVCATNWGLWVWKMWKSAKQLGYCTSKSQDLSPLLLQFFIRLCLEKVSPSLLILRTYYWIIKKNPNPVQVHTWATQIHTLYRFASPFPAKETWNCSATWCPLCGPSNLIAQRRRRLPGENFSNWLSNKTFLSWMHYYERLVTRVRSHTVLGQIQSWR